MAQNVSVHGTSEESAKGAPATPESRPWWPLASLRGEIDHLFDEFMSSWPFGGRESAARTWSRLPAAFHSALPATDVVENGKAFVVTVDLPGVEEKDIDVSVSDDMLSIRAEVTEEHEEEKENRYLSERQHGLLQRAFRIPPGVDTARIEATCEKGVLKVTLPKSEEARQKQRKIKVEAR